MDLLPRDAGLIPGHNDAGTIRLTPFRFPD
jgi:hypothetical protein